MGILCFWHASRSLKNRQSMTACSLLPRPAITYNNSRNYSQLKIIKCNHTVMNKTNLWLQKSRRTPFQRNLFKTLTLKRYLSLGLIPTRSKICSLTIQLHHVKISAKSNETRINFYLWPLMTKENGADVSVKKIHDSWKLNGNIFVELFLGDLDENMTSAGCRRKRNKKESETVRKTR